MLNTDLRQVRPFLKWAGGKGRLVPQLAARFPSELRSGRIRRYVEPFVGSGALFFHLASCYPLKEFYLADANPELILLYQTVQRDVEALIVRLELIEQAYLARDEDGRRAYYYAIRDRLNKERAAVDFAAYQAEWIERSALLIFLNRTGYNGLFRVNRSGEFNVPFGRYKNPTICQAERLRAAAALLQRAQIHLGHFTTCDPVVDEQTFIYFDPPYRPLSHTAHFTAYSTQTFGDAEQLALAQFYRELDQRGAKLMLSNSDPQNINPGDTFFEDAYRGFRIECIQAGRHINSQASRRGPINELLILNW
jgi:DNA adenine methylase